MDELKWGKLHKFTLDVKVKLFRVEEPTHRTYYLVNNGTAQEAVQGSKEMRGLRWCVEQLHREEKQLTGIEPSQGRLAREQRSHILAATLVWTRLKSLAYAYGETVYRLKKGMLGQFLCQQLMNPAVSYD